MGRRREWLLWATVVTACVGPSSELTSPTQPAAERDARTPTPGWGRGGPHLRDIKELDMLTDGAVVTRDESGVVKLWPTLDGSREPVPIGDRAQRVDAAPRDGGWLVAAIRDPGVDLYTVNDSEAPSNDLRELVEREFVFVMGDSVAVDVAVFRDGVLLLDAEGRLHVTNPGQGVAPVHANGRYDELIRIPNGQIFALDSSRHSMGVDLKVVELIPGASPTSWVEELAFETFHLPRDFSGGDLAFDARGERMAWIDTERGRVSSMSRGEGPRQTTQVGLDGDISASGFGFVDDTHIILNADMNDETRSSHLMDLETGALFPRICPVFHRGQELAAPLPAAYGHDLRVLASGRYLSIDHPLKPDDPERGYLGYEPFAPIDVALAPDEQTIAYATRQGIEVERVDGESMGFVRTPREPSVVRFADAGHILVVSLDALRIVEIETGEVVAESGLRGVNFRLHAFEADGAGLRAVLELEGGPMAYVEATRDEGDWTDPRMWLIPTDSPSGAGLSESGVWTHTLPKLHVYPETAIKAGYAADDIGPGVELDGVPIVRRDAVQVSIHKHTQVRRTRAGEVEEWSSDYGPIKCLHEGPADGTRDYLELARGDLGLIALDRRDWTTQWVAAWGTTQPKYVDAGEDVLVIADGTGAAVIDATNGELVRRRCGGAFGRFTNPPDSPLPDSAGLCTEY